MAVVLCLVLQMRCRPRDWLATFPLSPLFPSHSTLMPSSPAATSPLATITIPPAITGAAWRLATDPEPCHDAWRKLRRTGRYSRLASSSLDDLSELADWASCALSEPEQPLSRGEKAAYQILLERVGRWACLEPLGPVHCQASAWR